MRHGIENVLVFTTENVDLSTASKLEFYLKQRNGTFLEYVPGSLVDSYKAATNWSTYAAQIKPLSEYTGG